MVGLCSASLLRAVTMRASCCVRASLLAVSLLALPSLLASCCVKSLPEHLCYSSIFLIRAYLLCQKKHENAYTAGQARNWMSAKHWMRPRVRHTPRNSSAMRFSWRFWTLAFCFATQISLRFPPFFNPFSPFCKSKSTGLEGNFMGTEQ